MQVRLEQKFKNPAEAKEAIEAVYRFPLDAGPFLLLSRLAQLALERPFRSHTHSQPKNKQTNKQTL